MKNVVTIFLVLLWFLLPLSFLALLVTVWACVINPIDMLLAILLSVGVIPFILFMLLIPFSKDENSATRTGKRQPTERQVPGLRDGDRHKES